MSNNFKFGNKREGNVIQLINYENQYNYKIIKPEPLKIKNKIFTFEPNILKLIKQTDLAISRSGANTTSSTGLKAVLADDQKVMIRSSSSFQFSGVQSTTTRPSSALIFDEAETVYRTLAFNTTDALGTTLGSGVRHIRFDSPYDYIKLVIDNTNAALTTHAGSGGTTMGNTAGDDVIAVVTITSVSYTHLTLPTNREV
mgnify:CR=1 FL=1